mmetsp:Transcript_19388/g.25553  ORF Transcript_19388/g.25553 Transcript_19388/m.25553 type:complete len:243 (+) Transcript_19388:270-998(+)
MKCLFNHLEYIEDEKEINPPTDEVMECVNTEGINERDDNDILANNFYSSLSEEEEDEKESQFSHSLGASQGETDIEQANAEIIEPNHPGMVEGEPGMEVGEISEVEQVEELEEQCTGVPDSVSDDGKGRVYYVRPHNQVQVGADAKLRIYPRVAVSGTYRLRNRTELKEFAIPKNCKMKVRVEGVVCWKKQFGLLDYYGLKKNLRNELNKLVNAGEQFDVSKFHFKYYNDYACTDEVGYDEL